MSSGYDEPEKLMKNHLEFQKLLDQISEQTEISQSVSPTRDIRTPGPSECVCVVLLVTFSLIVVENLVWSWVEGISNDQDFTAQTLEIERSQSEIEMLRNIQAARSSFSEQRKTMNESSWRKDSDRRHLNEGNNVNGYAGIEKETQLYTELGYLVQVLAGCKL
eukprot:753135-Hanusia_phi.AAC.6